MASQNATTPWSTLLFALLGLAWCGWIAFPTATPAPCLTSGCTLFRDVAIAGISLWWIGGGYFFLTALLCLRGKMAAARFLSMLALAIDAVFMLVMFFSAPCFDCLVVAAFIGLIYYSLRGVRDGWFLAENGPSLLLPVWFGLFVGNCILAADEALPRYTIGAATQAEVSVFFSPSCPACRGALLSLGNTAFLYPVAESAADVESIIKLDLFLSQGMPMREAVEHSIDASVAAPAQSFFHSALLTVQLLRNKAVVLRQGFRALPLIQINGMPGFGATSLDNRGARKASQPPGQAQTGPRQANNSLQPPLPQPPPAQANQRDSAPGRSQPGQAANDVSLPDLLRDTDQIGSCRKGEDPAFCGEERRSVGREN